MLLVSLIFLSAFHVLLADDGSGARGSGIPDSVSGIHLVFTKHNIGIGRVPPQSTLFLGYAWHLHNGGFLDLIEVSAPLCPKVHGMCGPSNARLDQHEFHPKNRQALLLRSELDPRRFWGATMFTEPRSRSHSVYASLGCSPYQRGGLEASEQRA